mgnify:CR=1 FL=1
MDRNYQQNKKICWIEFGLRKLFFSWRKKKFISAAAVCQTDFLSFSFFFSGEMKMLLRYCANHIFFRFFFHSWYISQPASQDLLINEIHTQTHKQTHGTFQLDNNRKEKKYLYFGMRFLLFHFVVVVVVFSCCCR